MWQTCNLKIFVKWNDTLQVQSNTEVYSLFLSIYIYTVIYSHLIVVGLGSEVVKSFAWVAWILAYIARVGEKVRVGLKKLFKKNS